MLVNPGSVLPCLQITQFIFFSLQYILVPFNKIGTYAVTIIVV